MFTMKELGLHWPSEIEVPPWMVSGSHPDATKEITDVITDSAEWVSRQMGSMTKKQQRAMAKLVVRCACYGWAAALSNSPLATSLQLAQSAAVRARRERAEKRSQAVRDAFDAAGREGRDVSVESIAKECRVSRATAYRALQASKAK